MRPTYIVVLKDFVHVDALCVENRLFFPRLGCGLAQQAPRQASGLHDDGVLGQSRQDRGQVEVDPVQREFQLHLCEWSRFIQVVSTSELTGGNNDRTPGVGRRWVVKVWANFEPNQHQAPFTTFREKNFNDLILATWV